MSIAIRIKDCIDNHDKYVEILAVKHSTALRLRDITWWFYPAFYAGLFKLNPFRICRKINITKKSEGIKFAASFRLNPFRILKTLVNTVRKARRA